MVTPGQSRDLPVLIIGFNRPDLVLSLIEELREIHPSRVFFAIDGPRHGNVNDRSDVVSCQEMIQEIDWDCIILFNFATTNHGAGYWPKKAVDWALSVESSILVLEDDVRIAKSFYYLADFLLKEKANQKDIFAICAWNLVGTNFSVTESSYLKTRYFSGGGGWATWKEKWDKFNQVFENQGKISFFTLLKENNFNMLMALYYKYNFRKNNSKYSFSWDYEVMKYIFKNKIGVLLPEVNMAENIGIGPKATHTRYLPIFKKSEIEVNRILIPKHDQVCKQFEKKYRRIRLILFLKAGILKVLRSIKNKVNFF